MAVNNEEFRDIERGTHGDDDNAHVLHSIAISLKRIADTLAPHEGQDIGSTLFYIEQRLGPQS